MKMVSVNIGDTNVVFDNCMWTGTERIYVNGREVSKGFSWFGMDHIFEVQEDGEWIEYIVTTGVGCFWQGTRIKRDGLVIAETNTSGTKISLARPSKQVYKEVDLV